MIYLDSIKEMHKHLQSLLAKSKGKIDSDVREKICLHVSNVKNAINERIQELSDIADNPAEWKNKKDITVPRLQRERSQLVVMLEFWSGKGF